MHTDHTLKLIIDGSLYEALRQLSQIDSIATEAEQQLQNYSYLLQYFEAGLPDPSRSTMLAAIRQNCVTLYFKAQRQAWYHTQYTLAQSLLSDLESSTLIQEAEELSRRNNWEARRFEVAEEIFVRIALLPQDHPETLTHSDLTWFISTLQDPLFSPIIIGALYVSLSQSWHHDHFKVLQEAALRIEDTEVSVTAATALILICMQYDEMLTALYPDLCEGNTKALAKHQIEATPLDILEAITTTYCTEADAKRFETEVTPKLKNLASRISQYQDDLLGYLSDPEHRDDVADIEHELLGIRETLPQDRDMGYVNSSSFYQHSFWGHPARYFMPFSPHHPKIDKEVARIFIAVTPPMTDQGIVCWADCYAYSLVNYWEQLKEMMGELPTPVAEYDTKPFPDRRSYAQNFIFALYRFIHHSMMGRSGFDPFQQPQSPAVLSSCDLHEIIGIEGMMHMMYKHLALKQNHLAIELAVQEIEQGRHEPEYEIQLHRILAVAYYRTEEYRHALDHLLLSIQDQEADSKVAHRLGDLYAQLEQYEQAVEWYARAVQSEEADVPTKQGELLLKLGRPDEALRPLYQAFFITDGSDSHVVNLLAEALLRVGKGSEALERLRAYSNESESMLLLALCEYLQDEKKNGIDRLIAWCRQQSDSKSALAQYQKLFVRPLPNLTDEETTLLYEIIHKYTHK